MIDGQLEEGEALIRAGDNAIQDTLATGDRLHAQGDEFLREALHGTKKGHKKHLPHSKTASVAASSHEASGSMEAKKVGKPTNIVYLLARYGSAEPEMLSERLSGLPNADASVWPGDVTSFALGLKPPRLVAFNAEGKELASVSLCRVTSDAATVHYQNSSQARLHLHGTKWYVDIMIRASKDTRMPILVDVTLSKHGTAYHDVYLGLQKKKQHAE